MISAVILDPTRIDEVRAIIDPEAMYADSHRHILQQVFMLHDAGSSVDVTTVVAGLRSTKRLTQVGGPAYVAQILDSSPAIANVSDHARIVHNKSRARSALRVSEELSAQLRTHSTTPDEFQNLLHQSEASLAEISHHDGEPRLMPIRDLLSDTYAEIVAAAKNPTELVGCTTGFPDLDRATSGYDDGDLTIIAARPGMGKTSFELMSCVVSSEQSGKAAAFFSLEMPKKQLLLRILSMESRIPLQRIRRATLSPGDWTQLTAAVSHLSQVPLFIDDTPAITVLDMRARLRRLSAEIKSGKYPGVTGLVRASVDYLQLMGSVIGGHRGVNREQEISDTTRRLKHMAKELHIPINALSQLNRVVEGRKGKRPELADLRESGAIEQDADRVMFIYREEYYDEDTPARGIAEVIIAKQRNGPTGKWKLRFTGETTRFDSLGRDDIEWDEEPDEFEDGGTGGAPYQDGGN